MGANTLIRTSSGARIPDELLEMNRAVEKIMKWGKDSMTVTQGSRSVAVGASGNTHGGDDAEDLTANEAAAKEKYFRLQGGMFYERAPIKGVWSRHVHGGRDYSTVGSKAYAQQLVQYHKRNNALANFGPDTGYRMLVFPKHVYKGYIGYVQARGATNAYEQPTGKSKKITPIKRKQVTYVVAEMEVAGSRWYLTLTGKCIKASRFNKIAKPKTVASTRPAPVVATPAPTPSAPASKPTSTILNIGTRNVIVNRLTSSGKNGRFTNVKKGLSWHERKPLLAKDAAQANLDLLGTQEAGERSDMAEFATNLELATKHDWDFVYGGDNFDISQANLWDRSTLGELESGVVDLEGSDHDKLVWSRHRVKATGGSLLIGNLHSEWREGGKSAKGNQYDRLRERQSKKAMAWLIAKAEGTDDVVVLLGDFNSTAQNPYDGPGKAAAATGFRDCESAAKSQVRTEWNSYHGFESPKADKQFDRFFVLQSQIDSGQLEVTHFAVDPNAATKAGSDHYQTRIRIIVRVK